MLERPDLEDKIEEPVSIGECQHCKSEIMDWEDYYDFEGVLIHDECVLMFFHQFKKHA